MSACAFLSITRTEGPVALLVTLQVKQLCRDKKWEQHGLCLMKTIQGDSSFLSTKAPVMSWLYLAVSVLGISRFFQEGSSGKNCKGNHYFSSLDSGDFRVLVLRLMFDSICMTGTNEWSLGTLHSLGSSTTEGNFGVPSVCSGYCSPFHLSHRSTF